MAEPGAALKLYKDDSWLEDFDVDCRLRYSYRGDGRDGASEVARTVTASLLCDIGGKLHILTYPPGEAPTKCCSPKNLEVHVVKQRQDDSGEKQETINVVRLTEKHKGQETVLTSEHIAAIVLRDQGDPTETNTLRTMMGEKLYAKCSSQDPTKEGDRCNIRVYKGSMRNLETQKTQVQICAQGLKYGKIVEYASGENRLHVELEVQATNDTKKCETRGALVTSLGSANGELEAYGVIVGDDKRGLIAYPLKDALKQLTDQHFLEEKIEFLEK